MNTKPWEELSRMYSSLDPFNEGLARVRSGHECFHIHPDGAPTYEQRYEDVGSFSEGLARVRERPDIFKESHWFHIRFNGIAAYAERHYEVDDFCNGLAGVWERGQPGDYASEIAFYIYPNRIRVE